jgi:hypothetical protein
MRMESGSNTPKRQPGAAKRRRSQPARPAPPPEQICSLPLVGATTVEDAVFYAAIGVVAVAELVAWPTAALIAGGHALHQRAQNITRSGAEGEVREGLIEAFGDVA